MDPTVLLTDEDLRRWFGSPTYERAHGYVDNGNVLVCNHAVDPDGDLEVRGRVAGSRGHAYNSYVSAGLDADGVWFASRCDCPMLSDCKHVLALLLTVRGEQQRDQSAQGPSVDRRWELLLAPLLDELDDSAERTAAR
jgi:uncharacterized Zn finger protein